MCVEDFISNLEAAGFSVTAKGPDLVVTPASKLTDQQRQFIRQNKAEFMSELQREAEQRYFGFLITRLDGSQFFSYSVPFMNMQEIRIQYHNTAAIEPVTNEVYPNDRRPETKARR
jgi:virulence-associated protein VagC